MAWLSLLFCGMLCCCKGGEQYLTKQGRNQTQDILRGAAHFETGSFHIYPLGFSNLLDYSRSPSNEHEFSTCKKVKSLKMFKNGRVDIRFTSETHAAEFAAKYLGLVC